MIKRRFALLYMSLALIFLMGCKVKFQTEVMRPAEVNLSKYKKIAIGEIKSESNTDKRYGDQGENISQELTQALFQSNRFEILDRQNLKKILDEHKLATADFTDQNSAVELGKILGPSALIFGRMADAHFNDTVDKYSFDDANGRRHTRYTRNGQATMQAYFQVTDLSTGKVIATKNLDKTSGASVSDTDRMPPEIDPAPHYTRCRDMIVDDFMKVIVPWKESVVVALMKYGKIPEVEQGINYAKIGDWEKAKDYFNTALQKAEGDPKITKNTSKMSKLYYNYGIALAYLSDFEESVKNLEKAYSLDGNTTCKNALFEVKRRNEEYKKLIEQEAVNK